MTRKYMQKQTKKNKIRRFTRFSNQNDNTSENKSYIFSFQKYQQRLTLSFVMSRAFFLRPYIMILVSHFHFKNQIIPNACAFVLRINIQKYISSFLNQIMHTFRCCWVIRTPSKIWYSKKVSTKGGSVR